VWHAYEDLRAENLDELRPDPAAVAVAVEAIAQVHTRFAGHPLLAECRSHAGDRGARFYSSQVRDAIRVMESLRPASPRSSREQWALRDRLLRRLERLLEQEPERLRVLGEWGGPETLLHGDLWPKNVLLERTAAGGLRARLIDWDRAAVGPVSYDVSTFLSRLPPRDRGWVLDRYRAVLGRAGLVLPADKELGRLFDLAEASRLANCVIWPALDAWDGGAQSQWAWDELEQVDQWFASARPILPAVQSGGV
jgi:Ser/Thr protein kinase RdoA (MazF antagonist)